MVLNITQYERKAQQCNQATLCEAFVVLLKVVNDVVGSDDGIINRIKSAIDPLFGNESAKAVVKRKAAPKKKAPPPKTTQSKAASSKYYPLFWVPTSGDPVTTREVRGEVLPLDTREAVRYLQVRTTSVVSYLELPSESVYSAILPPEMEWKIRIAAESGGLLDQWFSKANVKKSIKIQENAVAKTKVTRPSMVPATYSQRLGILIYTLKKSCGNMDGIEEAILQCSLGQNEVGLLSETLQNPLDNDELHAAVKCIRKALVDHPIEWLYDDERFIYFISEIPNVRERMCALYVAMSFTTVSEKLLTRMKHLQMAMECLVLNENIHLLHRLVLTVGNALNSGTVRDGLKYFKLSTFGKLVDVRGNEGMTLLNYLSHFTGELCTPDEIKFLTKAAQYGVTTTYNAARDLINTYVVLAGLHSDSNLMPRNSTTVPDCFEQVAANYAQELLDHAKMFVETYYAFLASYTAAAYFFGDPNAVLPLDGASNKKGDDDDDKDLLLRYLNIILCLKTNHHKQFQLPRQPQTPDVKPPQKRIRGASDDRPAQETLQTGYASEHATGAFHPSVDIRGSTMIQAPTIGSAITGNGMTAARDTGGGTTSARRAEVPTIARSRTRFAANQLVADRPTGTKDPIVPPTRHSAKRLSTDESAPISVATDDRATQDRTIQETSMQGRAMQENRALPNFATRMGSNEVESDHQPPPLATFAPSAMAKRRRPMLLRKYKPSGPPVNASLILKTAMARADSGITTATNNLEITEGVRKNVRRSISNTYSFAKKQVNEDD